MTTGCRRRADTVNLRRDVSFSDRLLSTAPLWFLQWLDTEVIVTADVIGLLTTAGVGAGQRGDDVLGAVVVTHRNDGADRLRRRLTADVGAALICTRARTSFYYRRVGEEVAC